MSAGARAFTLGAALAALAPLAGCGGERISIVDLDGVRAAVERHRGQAVLLNFWAIWCPPCVAELDELLETYHEHRDTGGVVLGVSYDLMVPGTEPDTALAEVREFVARRGIDYPILIYDEDDYDAINDHFDLPGAVPVTLAIDREGRIVDRHAGQADKDRFVEMMRRALGS